MLFIIDDLHTTFLDIWLHFLNDFLESAFIALKHVKKKLEFIKLPLFKEVNYSSFLISYSSCHVSDELTDDDFEHLGLGGWLEPVISIDFLLGDGIVDLSQILLTVSS